MTPLFVLSRQLSRQIPRRENYFESAAKFLLITAPAQKHQGPGNHRIWILSSKCGKFKKYFLENTPEARRDSVNMTQFVYADHVGNMINCCPDTGILVYLFRALIIWYNKK